MARLALPTKVSVRGARCLAQASRTRLRRGRFRPAQCGRHLATDRCFKGARYRLAVRRLVEWDRFAPGQHHIDGAATEHADQMRPEREITVPGDHWAVLASERKPVQARV